MSQEPHPPDAADNPDAAEHPDAAEYPDVDPAAVDFEAVQGSPQFRKLRKRHRSFVFPLTVIFLAWYFAYVLLADYAHEFMSIRVVGNITTGLILGLLQIATTFAITMWYVRYANKKLDPVAESIRDDADAGSYRSTQQTEGSRK